MGNAHSNDKREHPNQKPPSSSKSTKDKDKDPRSPQQQQKEQNQKRRTRSKLELPDLADYSSGSRSAAVKPIPIPGKSGASSAAATANNNKEEEKERGRPRSRDQPTDQQQRQQHQHQHPVRRHPPQATSTAIPAAPTVTHRHSSHANAHQRGGPAAPRELDFTPAYHTSKVGIDPALTGPLDSFSRYESKDGLLRLRQSSTALPPQGARQQAVEQPQQQQQQQRSSRGRGFKEEIVRSSVPTGMRRVEGKKSGGVKIPVKLTWNSRAQTVYVTGTFSAVPWRKRTLLTPIITNTSKLTSPLSSPPIAPPTNTQSAGTDSSSASSSVISQIAPPITHEVTIPLSPGVHSFKFIVDDVYMCSEDLQTVTDAEGNLVNVLEVVSTGAPSPLVSPRITEDSAITTTTPMKGEGVTNITLGGPTNETLLLASGTGTGNIQPPDQFWSSDEEDGYFSSGDNDTDDNKSASNPESTSSESNTTRKPRQSHSHSHSKSNSRQKSQSRGRHRSQSGKRGKRGRERRRVSKWTNEPPVELEAAADLEARFLENTNQHAQQQQSSSSHSSQNHQNQQQEYAYQWILGLIPPAPLLPNQLRDVILNSSGKDSLNSSTHHSSSSSHARSGSPGSAIPLPIGYEGQVRKSSPASANRKGSPTVVASGGYVGAGQGLGLALAPRFGEGAVTGEAAPGMGDDKSILPAPSHVVLNHLSTGAIRGGVLACAATVRYRHKFITTVYYKPTSPGSSEPWNPAPPQAQAQAQNHEAVEGQEQGELMEKEKNGVEKGDGLEGLRERKGKGKEIQED